MTKIAVFASGRGSNLQAIMDACKNDVLDAEVCVVISDNSTAMALDRATRANIPAFQIPPNGHADILDKLSEYGADIVVLSGYLKKIDPIIIDAFPNKIINIHPSLLPKYGGKGMYGLAVHREVIANGDEKTGITIHHVTDEYDEGNIINQLEIRVGENATPESLANHIMQYEHIMIVQTVKWLIENGA